MSLAQQKQHAEQVERRKSMLHAPHPVMPENCSPSSLPLPEEPPSPALALAPARPISKPPPKPKLKSKPSQTRPTMRAAEASAKASAANSAMRSETSFNSDQKLELHRYYHSVDIASARVDAVLAKLDAPMRAKGSVLEKQIGGWQKELCLDDHPEYVAVRFDEKRDRHMRGELNR
jgi:hypothetical protein